MGLALGRRVIIIDNINSKLSRYFASWGAHGPPVDMVATVEAAYKLATKRII